MRIDLEPLDLRYVYVNPETNQLHVLVSVMGGIRVGTDNTCQSAVALGTFFDTILSELNHYKNVIESELKWMTEPAEKSKKAALIQQIKHYLNVIQRLEQEPQILRYRNQNYPKFPDVLAGFMKNRSNLFSMRLCPTTKDSMLRMVEPVFSVDREGGSSFYHAMQAHYSAIQPPSPRERLIQAVVESNPQSLDEIQTLLSQKIDELFKIKADFMSVPGNPNENMQDYLNRIMQFEQSASVSNYADALISCCGGEDLWSAGEDFSPFLAVPNNIAKVETYSILTQFFLAELNIYCFAHQYSSTDFGKQLDQFPELSKELAQMVVNSVNQGRSVEKNLIHFINTHASVFELTSLITDDKAIDQIIEQARLDYFTIKESPHFDEFMILDTDTPGQFVTHLGAICIDLSRMLQAFPHLDNPYFQGIRADAERLPGKIFRAPIDIQPIEGTIEDFTTLLTALFQKNEIKLACRLIQKNMLEVLLPPYLHPLMTVLTKTNEYGANILMQLARNASHKVHLKWMLDIVNKLPETERFSILNQKNRSGNYVLITLLKYNQEAVALLFDGIRTLSSEYQQRLFESLSIEHVNVLNEVFPEGIVHFFGHISTESCLSLLSRMPMDKQRSLFGSLPQGLQLNIFNAFDTDTQEHFFIHLDEGKQCELFNRLSDAQKILLFKSPRIHNTSFFINLALDPKRLMLLLTFPELKILFEGMSEYSRNELFQQLSETEQVAIFRAVHPHLQGSLLRGQSIDLSQKLMQSITTAQMAEILNSISPRLYCNNYGGDQVLTVFNQCLEDQKPIVFSLITPTHQGLLLLEGRSDCFFGRLFKTISLEQQLAIITDIYREEEKQHIKHGGLGDASHSVFNFLTRLFELKPELFKRLSMDIQASFFGSLHTNEQRANCKEWLTSEALVEMIVTTGHPVFYQLFDEKQQLNIFKLFSPKQQARLLVCLRDEETRQRTFLQTLDSEQLAFFILEVHQAGYLFLQTKQVFELLRLEQQVAAMRHLPEEIRDSILNKLSEPRRFNITIGLQTDEELSASLSRLTHSIAKSVFQGLSKERQLAIFKYISISQQYDLLLEYHRQRHALIDTLSLPAQSNLIFSFDHLEQRVSCFQCFNEVQQKQLLEWAFLSGNDLKMSEWVMLLFTYKSVSLVQKLSIESQLILFKSSPRDRKVVALVHFLPAHQCVSLFRALTQEGNGGLEAIFLKSIHRITLEEVVKQLEDQELTLALSQNHDVETQQILLRSLPLERRLSIFYLMPADLKAKFLVTLASEDGSTVLASYKAAYQSLAEDEKKEITRMILFELKPDDSSRILDILPVSIKNEMKLEMPRCPTVMDNSESVAPESSFNAPHPLQEEVIVSDLKQHANGESTFNPKGAVFIVLMSAAQSLLKQYPSTRNALILTGVLGASYLLLKNIFSEHAPQNTRFFEASSRQGQTTHSTQPDNPDAAIFSVKIPHTEPRA